MPGALVALAEQLQRACTERGLTVAVAESCTGGLIAATITEVAGSSGYFLGGVVSYANEARRAPGRPTHVACDPRRRERGGRGSDGDRRAGEVRFRPGRLGHGVAGPDGGTASKPVGLTYVGMAGDGPVEARRWQFDADAANREAAARAALEWLLERASR